jgi:hypothetical protein
MRRVLPLLAVLAVAGCGATERTGAVGDALKGKHVQAKLLAWVPTVPAKRLGHDITGLSTPAHGMRFAAADIALCNDTGAAAIAWHFELRLDDSSSVHPQTASQVYDDQLDTVRDGCDRGWIVYQVPKAAKVKTLHYEFDWSHQTANGSSYSESEHDRFDWSL